ncbi:MAG: T9SS type A sorting domain-containing protein [Flavobacteriales bacterium]|nr:T9SS type A sorting domain-containing protein [Flavobacteriales bacterium]
MKHLATIFTLLAIVFLSTNDSAYTFSTGAPAGKTGSPGDEGISCNSPYCHSGPAAGSGENIAISVIQPLGQDSYRISIEVSNSGGMQYEKVGFQACVEDASGNKIGEISLVDPIRTKFPNGNSDYVTHTLAGSEPSDNFLHLWEFDWTPPVNFEGQASTVYVASMLTNNDDTNTGDVHVTNNYTFNVGVSIEQVELFDFSAYPNPAKDEIHISFSQKRQEDVVVLLYDLKGSKTVLFDGTWNQKVQTIILPLDLEKGVYTLEVQSINGQSTQLLAIQ